MIRSSNNGAESAADFHILSFEGPDEYARAGGIASRITNLTQTLAEEGHNSHLWFIGDPQRPGHETTGHLTLHRWCQWISDHHPGGVYDGEEWKRADYASSLPPILFDQYVQPRLENPGRRVVVMAEEWQTVDAVLHLDALLRNAALRDRVTILWNANNVFGFERIDWQRLAAAATITTVSRYMRHLMWKLGVDPLVIPNGIGPDFLKPPDREATLAFQEAFRDRLVLTKVARWDPDKRWLLAVDIVAELKRRGWRPLLVARGGVESHGAEVRARAEGSGLRMVEREIPEPAEHNLVRSFENLGDADVVSLRSYLTPPVSRILFRSSAAVLANSGREPFGLVALEAMAAGGVACVGGTGEDYAVPGWNSLLVQTQNPLEFLGLLQHILTNPEQNRAVRTRATQTARCYTWNEVIRRDLLPRISMTSENGNAPPVPRQRAPRRRRAPVYASTSPTGPSAPRASSR
jgi:glycosyltransferase involved in cell wall biosynthesis